MLKETVAGLNAKVARLEEAINGNVDRAKTMPLKEVFKNMKTKTEQM